MSLLRKNNPSKPGKPNFIYCEKCHVEKFTKGTCPTCYKPVMTKTDPYITHNKRTWHASCFKCFKCHIDVASNPMVDLKGRPCCEECLMAQAGSSTESNSPQMHESEPYVRTSPTPGNRSMTSSPVPSPSPLPARPRPASHYGLNSSSLEVAADLSSRLQLNLSPLDLNIDRSLLHQTNSPLSAQSTSSQFSLGGTCSRNSSSSSGYTSTTSISNYSGLGRKRSDSLSPSAFTSGPSTSILVKADCPASSAAGSPVLAHRRPSSALSIHSYTSSRPSSPPPHQRQDHESEDAFKSDDCPRTIDEGQEQGAVDNMSESTLHGPHHSRSQSLVGLDDIGPQSLQQSKTGMSTGTSSQNSSRPATPSLKTQADSEIAAAAEKLSVSDVARSQPQAELQKQPSSRPVLGRARSRSAVGPSTAASVRARTEAYMNQANFTANSPSTSRSSSQLFGYNRNSATFSNLPKQPAPTEVNERDSKDFKAVPAELEPNRANSFSGHARQRSNTVPEAMSFPVVNMAEVALSPLQQRAASIPEGHCHKCMEKVTENGVRLQNGDRYHIACFLCNGCKQVFTESEFHVVFGRPYHPHCVSMAGPTSTMGAVTKCQQCHKVIGNKSIRFSGLNYHPQCFACSHCSKVLTSTSRFFEVDGRVECEQCCDERDHARLPPKVVPVARAADHFPMPVMAPSGPGGITATGLSRSGSVLSDSGAASPLRSPGSPSFAHDVSSDHPNGGGLDSPVLVMAASPLAQRATPPALTSFFGTRTRPLPKFGGVKTCPRCQQAVGVMDQVPGPKNEKWHKKCLNCKECKKVLDSSALTRGEGEAFCRACFNKTRTRA
ncbi:hypothetical protein EDD11_002194 [Mortierella claussenii]|nr:hypothetical protein EDD11_002194 [Mortierella claussenii]